MVKIQIMDVNDNYPIFPNLKLINANRSSSEFEEPIFETYERIEENAKLNTRIAQLRAVDYDKQKNVTFKIVQSSDPTKSVAVDRFDGTRGERGRFK